MSEKKETRKQVTIHNMPIELYEELKEIAKRECRSLNGQINYYMKIALENKNKNLR